MPDLTGLRSLHIGWWLGEVKRDRFEPSHAFALGAPMLANGDPSIARRTVNFNVGDPDLLAYMKGETIGFSGEDGWTLVTVDTIPLGWAKRVAGRLKSHYPKGLRIVGG
jgi:NOL1/NOP2/fmu family ribosome biogenesis protein